jgi:hypothetical protein
MRLMSFCCTAISAAKIAVKHPIVAMTNNPSGERMSSG